MWKYLLLALKISRPPLWIALPLVFCMGLAYGQKGFTDSNFQFTPLMCIQMALMSFPFCLFTFGLNDIHDRLSDQVNPRKQGIEGGRLDAKNHRIVKIAVFGVGVIILCVSALTFNPLNLFYSVALLAFSFAYSTPPWRLKTRPPLDVVTAGIMGFLAPFAMGFSFVDDATALPLHAYYFTFCVMGFHAFSTIMDYDVDKRTGDRTFAVAYGKRAAALFPAGIFLFSFALLKITVVKLFFALCISIFVFAAVYPSEKMARYFFLTIYACTVIVVAIWVMPYFF